MNFLGEQKKKKQRQYFYGFLFVFLIVGFFLCEPHSASAQLQGQFRAAQQIGGMALDKVGEALLYVFNWLLYAILHLWATFLSVAVTIFGFAVKPEYFKELFNLQGVYDTWKFVRDFFNLFFILTLLYIAFTVVFQIQKDFKKALLSLVLAALFVNFSFPVSRVLIDATNVPMYFFINQTLVDKNDPTKSLGTILSASNIKGILIPSRSEIKGEMNITFKLIASIVAMCLLSVTLFVLSLMLLIRVIALLILVVFSPVGFVASIIPGMERYSKMWWDNFWQYALFGPAAGLMLLISIRFMAEIEKSRTLQSMKTIAGGNSMEVSLTSSFAMYSIPIILLWFTIGLANKFSIAGAGTISGKGEKFAKWAMKKTAYDNPLGRGIAGGVKKVGNEGKILGMDYGKRVPILTGKYWTRPSEKEARIKGFITGGKSGAKSATDELRDKQVREKAEEHKKDKTSHADLVADMSSNDDVKKRAAALALAEREDVQNGAEFAQGLAALDGNEDMKKEFIRKSQNAIKSFSDLDNVLKALGNDSKTAAAVLDKIDLNALPQTGADYAKMVNSQAFLADPTLVKKLETKLKKEGRTKALVDYQVNVAKTEPDVATAVKKLFDDMTAEDVAKQKIFTDTDPVYSDAAKQYIRDLESGGSMNDIKHAQEVRKKMSRGVSSSI